jgi:transcription antitermination factor NusG
MLTAAIYAQVGPRAAASPVNWYAACTYPRHEKRVLQHLTERSIESFLPLYQTVHAWKDRKKVVELPLFPGYIFVHIPLEDRLNVLQTPSIVRFVTFDGRPAPLPDSQIESLRTGCDRGARFEPHPFLKAGARVRIKHGCLADAEGVVVRRKQSLRFVLCIELLQRAVSVEVDAGDIEPIR